MQMVLSTHDIIDHIESLPVEGRAHIIDTLLRSMNQLDPAIDAAWVKTAQQRLEEIQSGRVQGIPAEQVFSKARERFDQ